MSSALFFRKHPKSTHGFILLLLTGMALAYAGCLETPYRQGKALYEYNCANCHMSNGAGLAGLIPPLADADYLAQNREKLACIIRFGLTDTIRVNGMLYDQPMEGLPQLNAVEINNIINYINHAWGNEYGLSRVSEVEAQLESCQQTPKIPATIEKPE